MENPEEILGSLEEFAKMKPKDIPRELEEYLKYVAKTGDPIYQWAVIKSLFREKFVNVITDFYESSVILDIPPCPNVEMFNYELMKGFILEKLDTFSAAPFTLQRICELLTNPKKEYSRIDKYMRALEKNVLVVSTVEPGGRRTENGESFMNGIESDHEHVPEPSSEINVEEMDESPYIQANNHIAERLSTASNSDPHSEPAVPHIEMQTVDQPITSTCETTTNATCTSINPSEDYVCVQYVAIEPMTVESTQNTLEEGKTATDFCVTIAAVNVKEGNEVVMADNVNQLTKAIITQVKGNVKENTEEVSQAGDGEVSEPIKDLTSEAKVAVEPNVEPTSLPPKSIEPEQPQEDSQMETDSVFQSEESSKSDQPETMEPSTEPTLPVLVQEECTDKDSTPSSTSPEPEKLCKNQPEETPKISDPVESETVSPENSISSSDSSCQSSGDTNITESDETSSSSLGDEAEQKQSPKLDEVTVVEKIPESSDAESVDSTTPEPKEDPLIVESLEKSSDEPQPILTPEKKSENSEVSKVKEDTEMETDVTPESTSDQTVKQEDDQKGPDTTKPPSADGEGNP